MRVGVLFKSFVSRECGLLRQAYVTYVRPLLEYACNVWSPYKLKHIRAIEKIQRNFTRRIPAMRDLSYAERLARLNLDSLEIRRVRSDLVLYYKILNGLTNFNPDDVFDVRQNVRLTRSHDKRQLCKPICRSKVLENNFLLDVSLAGTCCRRVLKILYRCHNLRKHYCVQISQILSL